MSFYPSDIKSVPTQKPRWSVGENISAFDPKNPEHGLIFARRRFADWTQTKAISQQITYDTKKKQFLFAENIDQYKGKNDDGSETWQYIHHTEDMVIDPKEAIKKLCDVETMDKEPNT